MRGEVHTAPKREKHDRPFDGQRIKISDAGIVCRKTAQRHRRHRVAKRVKPAHPRKMQRQKSRRRRHCIEEPKFLCHLRNARCHLAFFVHSRNFGLEELRSAHAQHRQNRDRQHDDTHAAQPVEHMPPKIYRRIKRVQTCHDRRARRRQSGHCLKKRIGKTDARYMNINGHGCHQRKRQPQH